MPELSPKQYEILNFHTESRFWNFDSFENGQFTFILRPWFFFGLEDIDYEYLLSVSFVPEGCVEINPQHRLEEIHSMSSQIIINTDINWKEGEPPMDLKSFWNVDYWCLFHDLVKPSMWHRVNSLVELGLCKPQKQLTLGIAVRKPGPTLGQLVKLASFATIKDMMGVRSCGEKVVNEFLIVFKELGIKLDPKKYQDGKY